MTRGHLRSMTSVVNDDIAFPKARLQSLFYWPLWMSSIRYYLLQTSISISKEVVRPARGLFEIVGTCMMHNVCTMRFGKFIEYVGTSTSATPSALVAGHFLHQEFIRKTRIHLPVILDGLHQVMHIPLVFHRI